MEKQKKQAGPVRLSDISSSRSTVKKVAVKQVDRLSNHSAQKQIKAANPGFKKGYANKADAGKCKDSNMASAEFQTANAADPHRPQIWQGKISMIEVQKKNKERYNVYLDEAFAFGISEATLVRFSLHKGQELTPDEVNSIYQSERESTAYNLAVRFLSHRLRSKKEVYDKLKDEEIPDELILETVGKLEALKLIDDVTYGQSYTRTAALINQKGPNLIKRELKQKGLLEADIATALAEYDEADQIKNAQALAVKYFQKQSRKFSVRESKQKTSVFLMQKGYASDIVQQVLNEFIVVQEGESQEAVALQKQLEKYWHKHQSLAESERIWKIKGMMLGKGYASDDVNRLLNEMIANDKKFES